MKIEDYKVIHATEPGDLESKVKESMAEGFTVFGTTFTSPTNYGWFLMVQVMIKASAADADNDNDSAQQLGEAIRSFMAATSAEEARKTINAAADNHTHGNATAKDAGFMSPADKSKLDGLNQVDAPGEATEQQAGLMSANDKKKLNGLSQVTVPGAATTTSAGMMSAADKTKLDGIAAKSNNYTLPAATTDAIGGVKQLPAMTDVLLAPTALNWNQLLAAMRTAGMMKPS